METNSKDFPVEPLSPLGQPVDPPEGGVSPEREVQRRIVGMMCERMGYEYLGNLADRENECLDREALK